jgi:hypothetical protein
MARRILIVSDRHPLVSGGIGPLAAHRLFEALGRGAGIQPYFLAAADAAEGAPLGVAMFQPFGPSEYLIATHGYNAWLGANGDDHFPDQLAMLLRRIEPDIVHFQSWAAIGIEAIAHARRLLPAAKIGVALAAPSMMPVSPEGAAADPALQAASAASSPGRAKNDVLLRWLFQRRFLRDADAFFVGGPSDALQAIAAGLPEDRAHVVTAACLSGRIGTVRPAGTDLIVGVFGFEPVSDGGEFLTRVARLFAGDARIRIEIQPIVGDPELPGLNEADITVLPPISPADIAVRMQDCHIVLIPGPFCDHAGILVQEARVARRPVLCPAGGLAAGHVGHGVDGFHFTPSVAALVEILGDLLARPDRVREAQERVGPAFSPEDAASAILAIYDGLPALAAAGATS